MRTDDNRIFKKICTRNPKIKRRAHFSCFHDILFMYFIIPLFLPLFYPLINSNPPIIFVMLKYKVLRYIVIIFTFLV